MQNSKTQDNYHCCSEETVNGHDHSQGQKSGNTFNIKPYIPAIFSFMLLMGGILLDYFDVDPFQGWVRIVWYITAYAPVGFPVIKQGIELIFKGSFFTEFFLMGIATLGAFAIGEYPEGVAVMLFYTVGELFQGAAVKRARGNIKALLDVRPKEATVLVDGKYIKTPPEKVEIGSRVQVKVGEKVPLDGVLRSKTATLNTAAITGESKPDHIFKGEKVYAGSINLEQVVEIETTKKFKDSSIARILQMVENATARKSKTELFIRKFAKVYTPIVFFAAVALTFLPYFFTDPYIFEDWLYRALIFLVISCPCALVVSIPLGYFGGLGAASRNGLLFKGASFLDAITKVNTLVMDKTGTVTKGVFSIAGVYSENMAEKELMKYLRALEKQSTHPIAKALLTYSIDEKDDFEASEVKEIPGQGLKGLVDHKTVLAGNKKLMHSHQISIPQTIDEIVETVVIVSIEGQYAGHVIIADELKDDAQAAIEAIRKTGINTFVMLSGDKHSITEKTGSILGMDIAKGGLLPEDKLQEVENLKNNKQTKVAFVGDGINDAPVLAASDVGIAMGALGSDVAIETADVVIQTDQPSKIATAIKIGKSTRSIVWQNIALAFGVKLIVLLLGAGGLATMWEAVFADVGVALLAILNAVRLQRMHWK